MTGQDFQDRLEAVIRDLQTSGRGQTVNFTFRDNTNTPVIMPLSSSAVGVVNAAQLATIQAFIDALKPIATTFETERTPVTAANQAVADARIPFAAQITAANTARETLATALGADPTYQAALIALDTAKTDADFVAAQLSFQDNNVLENYQELQAARGKYTE